VLAIVLRMVGSLQLSFAPVALAETSSYTTDENSSHKM